MDKEKIVDGHLADDEPKDHKISLHDWEYKALIKMAEDSQLNMSLVIEKLIQIGIEFGIITDSDWKDNVANNVVQIYADKENVRFDTESKLRFVDHNLHEASREKDRQIQNKQFVVDRFLKSRTDAERHKWWDDRVREIRVLNDDEYSTLPVVRNDGKLSVQINGKTLLVTKMRDDGFPELEFNQDRLVKCLTGFHTIGSWCYNCPEVNTCMIIQRERLDDFSRKKDITLR